MLIPTTLSMAAAAGLINFWLSMRVGQIRHAKRISVGDGGDAQLIRRMRAHLNFAENTPLVLIMIAAVEISGKGGVWLAPVAALFMLGRVGHGLGMDGGRLEVGRMIGTAITFLTQIGLAVVAVLISLGKM